MRPYCFFLLIVFSSFIRGQVIINEIYYNPGPDEDRTFEFLELYNGGDSKIDISRWQLSGGISFKFPGNSEIGPSGFVVVCRRKARFNVKFSLNGDNIYGDYVGSLGDDGDRIVLTDERNNVIETVSYHDQAPWPEKADGLGFSLQRICSTAPPFLGRSWVGEVPTPLAPCPELQCPAPVFPTPEIVISELNYHPYMDRDEDFEFVEIYNKSGTTFDLSGWKINGSAEFIFQQGTAIGPSEFLVVCRNVQVFKETFQIENAVGNFTGKLSNGGERIVLLDNNNKIIDSVFYGTSGDWPAAPDGGGVSLERISFDSSGEDPANWAACDTGTMEEFAEVSGTGSFDGTGRLKLFLDGQGECIVDDIMIEDVEDPGRNLVPNGSFDDGKNGWHVAQNGIHANSDWVPSEGVKGSGAIRVLALRSCGEDCGDFDSLYSNVWGLNLNKTYKISMKYKFIRGHSRIRLSLGNKLKVSGEVPGGPWGGHTAGRENSVSGKNVPPFLVGRGRYPLQPGSSDETFITATFRGDQVPDSVVLIEKSGGGEEYNFFDDGLHGDRLKNDSIWGVKLPARPHGTVFLYTISARLSDGSEVVYPDPKEPSRYFGYFVNDEHVDSLLPNYGIILPGLSNTSPEAVNSYLSCDSYRVGHFIFKGEVYPEVAVRFRGFTGCYMIKRHFKIRFNFGRFFNGLRKINLNSMWTDKALLREHLAWKFHEDIGSVYCKTGFVRFHVNGDYYGLYMELEHPDSRYLKRNGLNPDGDLYKALMGPYDPQDDQCGWTPGLQQYSNPEEYGTYWEQETNQDNDFVPLAQFIDSMHDSGGSLDFFKNNVDPESVILFQIGQVAINNFDSLTKNHFLFEDPDTKKWYYLPWDLDLSFGKYFTRDAVGPDRPVGTLNDLMSCPNVSLRIEPFYGADMTGCNFPGNWLVHYFFNAGNGYYVRAYLTRFWDVLQEKYLREKFDYILDSFFYNNFDDQQEDFEKWGRYPSNMPSGTAPPPEMGPNLTILKDQISCHRDLLLGDFTDDIKNHPRLRITELMVMPEGEEETGEFIELVNPDQEEIGIGNWSIKGVEYVFPKGITVPPLGVIVVAKDPVAFQKIYGFEPFGPYPGFLDNRGERLRVCDAGKDGDYPAVVDFLPYKNGGDWPEQWRGYSIEFTGKGKHVDNDAGRLWKRSVVVGGTPGRITGSILFMRGDIDQDGSMNLADPVKLLLYLVGGAEKLECMDSADVNNDGSVDLADAIYLLGYLFNNGEKPRDPFEECGFDLGVSLGCEKFIACH